MTRYYTEGCLDDVSGIDAIQQAALRSKSHAELAHDVAALASMVKHMRRLIDELAQRLADR